MVATATPTAVIKPQPGPQEAFLGTSADIAIYGGAAGGGKSFALLLEPLRHIEKNGFDALILRRTTKEVRNVGGLWDESEGIYPSVGAEARLLDLAWKWPSGNVVKFDHMEHEKDKFKYQGSQIPFIGFDELTHFSESQFWYLLSRNRSVCGVKPYVRATCNPDASSWVAKLVEWYIHPETGIAIPERSGVIRWFVRVGGQLAWGDTKEELEKRFIGAEPKSFTFIAATLDDNPALTDKDPGYRANLMSLPHVEQERLLNGNWKIVDTEGSEWPAEYFIGIYTNSWPEKPAIKVVALDPSLGRTDKSDYSAFVCVAKGHDGIYYVDANIARRPSRMIVDEGVEWMSIIRPQFFCCETNQFQELLWHMFKEELPRAGIPGHRTYSINNTLPKITRIRSLSSLLAAGRIKLRAGSPGCELLALQLMQFPLGDHDDGPDALEMAIRLCEELLQGTGHEEPQPLMSA